MLQYLQGKNRQEPRLPSALTPRTIQLRRLMHAQNRKGARMPLRALQSVVRMRPINVGQAC